MTDHSTGSDGQHRPRRAVRLGDSRAPATTVVVLAAAAIAVIAGFVVLRSITNQTDGSLDVVSVGATTTVTSPLSTTGLAPSTTTTATTTTTTTTTTAPSVRIRCHRRRGQRERVNRSATAMAAALEADGYTTAPVANGTGPRLERSIVYYVTGDPVALGVARLLVLQIPTARALPMPDPRRSTVRSAAPGGVDARPGRRRTSLAELPTD